MERVPRAALSRIQVLVTLAKLEEAEGREVQQVALSRALAQMESGAPAPSRQTVAWWCTRLQEDGQIDRLMVNGRPHYRLTAAGWGALRAAAKAPTREAIAA